MVDPVGQTESAPPPDRRPRRVLLPAAYVLALLAAGGAGLGLYLAGGSAPQTPTPSAGGEPLRHDPNAPQWIGDDLLDRPIPNAVPGAPTPVDADPAGIAPPAGVTREFAFRRRVGERVQETASYRGPVPPASAVRHYVRTLSERGYRRYELPARAATSQPDAPAGETVLRYVNGRRWARVSLRKARRDAKMVEITVTMTYPSPRTDED